jgi:hypothetical protein
MGSVWPINRAPGDLFTCVPGRLPLSEQSAYINSIANITGFLGNYVMGWLRDLTSGYDNGLLLIAAVCNVTALATLCIRQDKEMEQKRSRTRRLRRRGMSPPGGKAQGKAD